MGCEDCGKHTTHEESHRIEQGILIGQMNTANKRSFIIILILIIALIGTNLGWLIYESQFETATITQEVQQEADNGINTFIGGDVIGETDS